jgi:hypothetical protein
MAPVEYVTSPSGIVHLIDAMAKRTLCGRGVTGPWMQGDETVSGLAATCEACKAVFDARA